MLGTIAMCEAAGRQRRVSEGVGEMERGGGRLLRRPSKSDPINFFAAMTNKVTRPPRETRFWQGCLLLLEDKPFPIKAQSAAPARPHHFLPQASPRSRSLAIPRLKYIGSSCRPSPLTSTFQVTLTQPTVSFLPILPVPALYALAISAPTPMRSLDRATRAQQKDKRLSSPIPFNRVTSAKT
jgi:hypothetical protein